MAKTDWLAHHASSTPAKTAIVDLGSERNFSFHELNQNVCAVANFLRRCGVQPGDRIAVYAKNSHRVLEVLFATWRIGAVYLPINFRLTPSEISFIIADATPSLVFFDSAFTSIALTMNEKWQACRWECLDEISWDSDECDETDCFKLEELDTAATAILMYSSGTTGAPKGVKITHHMVASAITALSLVTPLHHDMKSYAFMPLFHIGALIAFTLPAIFYGGCAVIDRDFDESRTMDYIGNPKFGITHVLALPTVLARLLAHCPEDASFSHLDGVFTGAEPVPKPVLTAWLKKGLNIQQGYGMTETTGVATLMRKTDLPSKLGSCGKPVFACALRVMTPEGLQTKPDQLGEIWMQGAMITPGYWADVGLSSFVDGWFKSGDAGRIDEDGFLFIEDRVKDMYISGGENVYPAEIEAVLMEHPNVSEVAVIGVPHDVWGETGCAHVILGEDHSTEDMLREHCADRLATYKIPSVFKLVDNLPRNATGKVLKFKLREALT